VNFYSKKFIYCLFSDERLFNVGAAAIYEIPMTLPPPTDMTGWEFRSKFALTSTPMLHNPAGGIRFMLKDLCDGKHLLFQKVLTEFFQKLNSCLDFTLISIATRVRSSIN
jgi:hypothetical protein